MPCKTYKHWGTDIYIHQIAEQLPGSALPDLAMKKSFYMVALWIFGFSKGDQMAINLRIPFHEWKSLSH